MCMRSHALEQCPEVMIELWPALSVHLIGNVREELSLPLAEAAIACASWNVGVEGGYEGVLTGAHVSTE